MHAQLRSRELYSLLKVPYRTGTESGLARSFNLPPTAPMGGGTQLFEEAHFRIMTNNLVCLSAEIRKKRK